jgi:signal peptidase I
MSNPRRKRRWKTLSGAALLVVALALLPAYIQAFTLSGASDAPTLLLGDWVWVNRASYDLRIPYSDRVLWSRAGAALGDLVLVETRRKATSFSNESWPFRETASACASTT